MLWFLVVDVDCYVVGELCDYVVCGYCFVERFYCYCVGLLVFDVEIVVLLVYFCGFEYCVF